MEKYHKDWYSQNKQKLQQNMKSYYLKNKTEILACRAKWYSENKLRICESNKNEYKNRPEKFRAKALKYNYGISLESYTRLKQEQGDTCKICCKKPNKRALSVDHCHVTGRIRGLLCSKCNMAIGLFDDSPELLQKTIEYLAFRSE